MAAREWVVPVVLGLVAAGLTYAFVPEDLSLPSADTRTTGRPDGPYVLMPLLGVADHGTTLLVFDETPAHGLGGVLTIHAGRVDGMVLEASEGAWLCARTAAPARCGPANGSADAASTLPRTAVDLRGAPLPDTRIDAGNLTADITFLAFTSSGRLLATNAPRSDWSMYDLYSEFTPFSQTTWHFGEGDAPPGASRVPLHRESVRAALDSTPTGGVQSIVVEDHDYAWLVGPVWVTARVEGIGPPATDG